MNPERIAEIRRMPHDNWRIVHELLDALDAANAELSRLRSSPAPVVGGVPETAEFKREDRFLVLKHTDLERYATPAQLRELARTCAMVNAGRLQEGKRLNHYVVVADDWPEYEETWGKIQARVEGRLCYLSSINVSEMPDEEIDQHLDAILRASGSALKDYSLHKSREDLRTAMRQALAASRLPALKPGEVVVDRASLSDLLNGCMDTDAMTAKNALFSALSHPVAVKEG